MNETTDKVIRDLAEKFGTTTEYLWGVLCRQAPISGVTNLLVAAAWIALIICGFKFVSRKTGDGNGAYPEWAADGAFAAWLIWGFSAIIAAFWIGAALEGIVSSLLNPEYWALKQIIK